MENSHSVRDIALIRQLLGVRLDLNLPEQDMPGVRLQTNELKICCWLPSIDISVHEIRLLLSIQEHGKLMILYPDLELVPFTRAVCDDTLVESLATDVVDRARRPKLSVDILTGRRISTAQRIDLYFESEVHSNEGRVVVPFAVYVGKTQKNSRIVILSPSEPLEFKDVVIEWDLCIEKAQIGAGR
jgi:hypothetical protein